MLFDTNRPEWQPLINPVAGLVYSATGDSVRDVLVAGGVVAGGRLTKVDEDKLYPRFRRGRALRQAPELDPDGAAAPAGVATTAPTTGGKEAVGGHAGGCVRQASAEFRISRLPSAGAVSRAIPTSSPSWISTRASINRRARARSCGYRRRAQAKGVGRRPRRCSPMRRWAADLARLLADGRVLPAQHQAQRRVDRRSRDVRGPCSPWCTGSLACCSGARSLSGSGRYSATAADADRKMISSAPCPVGSILRASPGATIADIACIFCLETTARPKSWSMTTAPINQWALDPGVSRTDRRRPHAGIPLLRLELGARC